MEGRPAYKSHKLIEHLYRKDTYRDAIFIILLVIYCILYDYPTILTKGPSPIHQWRQSDGLALTMSYYEQNAPFFEPRVYFLYEKDGQLSDKAVGEFPILYYITGKIWKITGKKLWIPRLLNIAITLSGFYFLYKLSFLLLKSIFWSYFIPIFLFTSPSIVHYTNNFLPDAPGLGLALSGLYFYFLHKKTQRTLYILYSILSYLIAGLIKITSLISLIAIVATEIYFSYLQPKQLEKSSRLWILIVLTTITITIIGAWYSYARIYSTHKGIFLTEILPIWKLNLPEILDISRQAISFTLPTNIPIWNFFVYLSITVFLLTNWRKVNKYYLSLVGILLLEIVAFCILFFRQLAVHDYYIINMLIILPLLMIVLVDYINIAINKESQSWIRYLAIVVLLMSTYHAALLIRLRYIHSFTGITAKLAFTVSDIEIENDWYHNEYYKQHYQALEEIAPRLAKEFGIQNNDRVVSIPDPSPNITLYLLNRKGFTDFEYGNIPSYAERLAKFRSLGAKYLILNDTTLLKESDIQAHISHILGRYKNVVIAALK